VIEAIDIDSNRKSLLTKKNTVDPFLSLYKNYKRDRERGRKASLTICGRGAAAIKFLLPFIKVLAATL